MDLEGRQKPTFDTHQIAAIINGSKRSHSGYHLLLNFCSKHYLPACIGESQDYRAQMDTERISHLSLRFESFCEL